MKINVSLDLEVEGFGKKLENARRKDSRSVEILAHEAGISRGYWYDLEKEKIRRSVPLETVRKIEQVLNVKLIDKDSLKGLLNRSNQLDLD